MRAIVYVLSLAENHEDGLNNLFGADHVRSRLLLLQVICYSCVIEIELLALTVSDTNVAMNYILVSEHYDVSI